MGLAAELVPLLALVALGVLGSDLGQLERRGRVPAEQRLHPLGLGRVDGGGLDLVDVNGIAVVAAHDERVGGV